MRRLVGETGVGTFQTFLLSDCGCPLSHLAVKIKSQLLLLKMVKFETGFERIQEK